MNRKMMIMVRDGMGWFTRWGYLIYWLILVGRTGRAKSGHNHLKLILCRFWFIVTKFHPNQTKNTEVKKFSVSVGLGWSGW